MRDEPARAGHEDLRGGRARDCVERDRSGAGRRQRIEGASSVGAHDCTTPPPAEPASTPADPPSPRRRPRRLRLPRAELLQRVYRADVLKCARGGGRMTALAFITERDAVRHILGHLRLPSTGPPVAPARSRPHVDQGAWQGDLAFDDAPDA